MQKENKFRNEEETIKKLQQIKTLAEECLIDLSKRSKSKKSIKEKQELSVNTIPTVELDSGMPLRPFVKKYAKGMGGPQKFTLLIAWFVKGDLKKEVALSEIQKHWNKMTAKSLLGMKFNRFYPGQAKENDWVESKRKGFYNLRPSWKEIFS